ncbi:MAG: response regulator, partial [Poseidonibacter sp.]|uniref:response regulator n=1 Tax=Poseidonibacter sp. TaxID=2321188 RepID=UPI00359E5CEC
MNKIKILYIDSDVNYGQNLLSYLLKKNYDIKYIKSFKEALIEISFFKPDILITDIDLIDGSGLTLIDKIRKYHKDISTVLLSSELNEKLLLSIISIKLDKFILKKQSFDLIENEINKIQIKEKNENTFLEEEFDLGEDYIYKKNCLYTPNEEIIKLTTQENSLLKILVQAKGECVSYEILKHSLSKTNFTSVDTIRTVIRKIRKKTFPSIIKNHSGIGYKINYYNIDEASSSFLCDFEKLDIKVLVLKGNTKNNSLLCYELKKFAIQCDSAYTIAYAKELINIKQYDYIISDLNLPDGEMIDFIREFEELSTTKMIVLSSSKDIHYKDYLYFKGILDYIIDVNNFASLSTRIYKTILKVQKNTIYNNILVIEQSKKISEQIKDLLIPRNYNVDILSSLEQSCEILKEKKYSVIILDITFDECFSFIRKVKNDINKSLPIILLTDTSRTYEIVRDAYSNGASECLRKPIYAEEFILKIEQHSDTSKLIYELVEQKELMKNYKIIVDQSSIISKTNIKGIITYVNKNFCDISGYSSDELIGRSHNIIRDPSEPKKLFENLWRTIKDEKKIWSGVLKNITKDGKVYYVQSSIMPVLDENKNIIEFIALRTDVTNI